jgi:predicted nucleic acid-binding protein
MRLLEAHRRVTETKAFATLHSVFETIAIPERQLRELLATMYLRSGFLESAADEWIAVATVRPDAPAMVGLAQVALARGFDADALAFAQHAVSLEPDHDAARIALSAITQKVQQVA